MWAITPDHNQIRCEVATTYEQMALSTETYLSDEKTDRRGWTIPNL